jgi:hypothetical protein
MKKCYSFFDVMDEGRDLRGLVIECLEGLPPEDQRCRHIKAGGTFADCPQGGRWAGEKRWDERVILIREEATEKKQRHPADRFVDDPMGREKPFVERLPEELILRRLLWLRHGCNPAALYGDDGELQCHECMIDFLRMPARDIEAVFDEAGMQEVAGAYAIICFLRDLFGYEH